MPAVPVTTTLYDPLAVPGSTCVALPQPSAVKTMAMKASPRTTLVRSRLRGRNRRTTPARLAPPPAANQPAEWPRLLVSGCAGVVLTVNETCPVPVIELGLTKQADSVRLAGMVQVRLIGDV